MPGICTSSLVVGQWSLPNVANNNATHDRACTHELTVAEAEYTDPPKMKAAKILSMDWGGAHEVPLLAEELLAIGRW